MDFSLCLSNKELKFSSRYLEVSVVTRTPRYLKESGIVICPASRGMGLVVGSRGIRMDLDQFFGEARESAKPVYERH